VGWTCCGSLLESRLEQEIDLSSQFPDMLWESASILFIWYGWNGYRAATGDLRALRRSVVLILRTPISKGVYTPPLLKYKRVHSSKYWKIMQ
jgi:hypothetical protein